MANLELLPRKEFSLLLDDGTIVKGKFGTWALKRYCQRTGTTLSTLQEKNNSDYTLEDVVEFILSAVEYMSRLNGQPFSYTDVHVCGWIDELGGVASQDLLNLLSHQGSEIKETEGEKKTDP